MFFWPQENRVLRSAAVPLESVHGRTRVRPPAPAHGVFHARRLGARFRPHGQGLRVGYARGGHDRPRRPLRCGRVLQGGAQSRHQAGARLRDLRRAGLDAREEGVLGKRRRIPSHGAGRKRRRLGQLGQAGQRRAPRGLLLQTARRQGTPLPPRQGADLPERMHEGGDQ